MPFDANCVSCIILTLAFLQDVARYIKDSLDEVPGTEDPSNIQGALQPIALCANAIDDAETETESANDIVDLRTETETEPVVAEDLGSSAVPGSAIEKGPPPPKTLLHFRDGEHSGEATLEEIVEGRDDGELSDYCQVFDQTTDSWLSISALIDRDNVGDNEKEKEPIEPEDAIGEEANTLAAFSNTIASIEMEPGDDFQSISKNDRKKPKRDVTAWGKGKVQTLTTKAEGNESEAKDPSISRRKKSKHIKPPPKLMRLCTQAMIQWDMLEDGDRLLLGLSGGKDSMSLLHVLLEFQKKLPIRFEIEVSEPLCCLLLNQSLPGKCQTITHAFCNRCFCFTGLYN